MLFSSDPKESPLVVENNAKSWLQGHTSFSSSDRNFPFAEQIHDP